jgi:hypothetical protein
MDEDGNFYTVREPKLQLKVNTEARFLLAVSEPYVVFTRWGYAPVIDVFEKKSNQESTLYISAQTLAGPLEELRNDNNGRIVGLEFWIRKETDAKNSKYLLE